MLYVLFLDFILLCFRSTVLEETHRRSLHISPSILQLTLLSNNNSNYHHVFFIVATNSCFERTLSNIQSPKKKNEKKKEKKERIRTGRHWRHYPRELYPLPSCNAILLIEISVHHIRTVL